MSAAEDQVVPAIVVKVSHVKLNVASGSKKLVELGEPAAGSQIITIHVSAYDNVGPMVVIEIDPDWVSDRRCSGKQRAGGDLSKAQQQARLELLNACLPAWVQERTAARLPIVYSSYWATASAKMISS